MQDVGDDATLGDRISAHASRGRFVASALASAAAVAVPRYRASAAPVPIRLGCTTISEEQVWLMKSRPDLTPGQGKTYDLQVTQFQSGSTRFKAYESGQLDGGVSSATGALQAASKGVPLQVVAVAAIESGHGFSSSFIALANSKYSKKQLSGATIALNGFRESFELAARIAALDAGINPERDVKFEAMPFSAMGDALRQGRVDIVGIVQPFYAAEAARGGIKTIFTTASALGEEEELNLYFNPDFLARERPAVRAFLSDFVRATHYYTDHTREAREAILQHKWVQMAPTVYLPMVALARRPDCKPSLYSWRKLQTQLLRAGFIEKPVDLQKVLTSSYLPA